MEWIAALIRAIGASFPGAASLVQLNSEIESSNTNRRLDRLEDPISALHPEVRQLSSEIYLALKGGAATTLAFDDSFYQRFGRPLAALEADGEIKAGHTLNKRYAFGFRITSPVYILYMAPLFESKHKMSKLVQTVDACKAGDRLDGNAVAVQLGIPVSVVRSVLELYRDKGYGLLSDEPGSSKYMAKV